MDEIHIRTAQPGDGQALAQIWLDAGAYYASLDVELFQIPEADGLAEWFEDSLRHPLSPDVCRLVAEQGRQVIGFIMAAIEQPVEHAAKQIVREIGQPRVLIDAVAIREVHRRKGLGTRLMAAVEAWARSKGAQVALLDTYHQSYLSVPFYERHLGYQRRALRFSKSLH